MNFFMFFTGVASIAKDSDEFSKMIWQKKAMRLHVNEITFRGNSSLPDNVRELKTPMQIFCYFFNKEIMKIVVDKQIGAPMIRMRIRASM